MCLRKYIVDVLQTPDLTSLNMTDYTPDSKAGAWPQKVKLNLPRLLFTHVGFPSVRVVLSEHLSPALS